MSTSGHPQAQAPQRDGRQRTAPGGGVFSISSSPPATMMFCNSYKNQTSCFTSSAPPSVIDSDRHFSGFMICFMESETKSDGLQFKSRSDTACSSSDRDSLLSFAANFPTLNWTAAIDCCSWDEIDCDDIGNWVVELSLPDRGLRGVIPSSLQSLNTISLLNLSCNFLSGLLPDGLFSSMNNLRIIDVSYNRFSGQLLDILPPTIQSLNFYGSCFNGTIQAAFLQAIPSLIALNVTNNTFIGVIPSSISDNSTGLVIIDSLMDTTS
ncbi:unnamed protein product [Lactuca virosa]|uniref:Leucine-rich repeat-containing N-terminal plant-type domain-containing protein n=1 Tax=Lactuca virosa TaxID=75947 RepID=A0AAU9LQV1_9ASTR|nr:unnamed protein product [Lactuca virosa]